MENFILGIGASFVLFGLIRLGEKVKKGKMEDLTEEEREWFI